MMTSNGASLALLAAIANEHRTALIELRGGMPLVQAARPLRQGTLPLLARQLVLSPKTATPGLCQSSPFSPLAPTIATQQVATKPAIPATSSSKPVTVTVVPSVPVPDNPTPKMYLQDLFAKLGIGESHLPKRFVSGDFVRPDDQEWQSYNDAANLVRNNDLDRLKAMHEEGKNLDACNRVGESLLHLACRRGHVAIAEFLMNDARVRWHLQDDFGRTVLHDACWRPSPSVELMEVLLRVVSPEWLLAQDVRGHTPFDYARREHMPIWYAFLHKREEMLKRRLALLT